MVPPADAPLTGGASWNREGTLLYVPDFTKGLYQVAASGGDPVPVFKLDSSKYSFYGMPTFLPDGKHFLYFANAYDPASSGTYFASMDGKENRLLIKGALRPTYGSGYLLYSLQNTDGASFRSGAGATRGGGSTSRGTGRFGFLWQRLL